MNISDFIFDIVIVTSAGALLSGLSNLIFNYIKEKKNEKKLKEKEFRKFSSAVDKLKDEKLSDEEKAKMIAKYIPYMFDELLDFKVSQYCKNKKIRDSFDAFLDACIFG